MRFALNVDCGAGRCDDRREQQPEQSESEGNVQKHFESQLVGIERIVARTFNAMSVHSDQSSG